MVSIKMKFLLPLLLPLVKFAHSQCPALTCNLSPESLEPDECLRTSVDGNGDIDIKYKPCGGVNELCLSPDFEFMIGSGSLGS